MFIWLTLILSFDRQSAVGNEYSRRPSDLLLEGDQVRSQVSPEHLCHRDARPDSDIELKPLSRFPSKVMYYCKRYNRSVYDASYLAMADMEKIMMVTSDEGLYNAAKKDVKWIKWLGDIYE